MQPLTVTSLTVYADRLEAVVRVAGPLRTSAYPGLWDAALASAPSLVGHACENESAHHVADELADTELPHLVEHLALDLMRRAGVRGRLRGDTSWDFVADGGGVFRVRLDCSDDAVALGALKTASQFVNAAVSGTPPPDLALAAQRLRQTKGRRRPKERPRRR